MGTGCETPWDLQGRETLWDIMMAEAAKQPEDQEYWVVQRAIQQFEPHTGIIAISGVIGKVISQTPDGEWSKMILEIVANPLEPRHATVRGTFYTRHPIVVDGVKQADFLIYIRQCVATRRKKRSCGVIKNCVVLHPGTRQVYSDEIE